MRSLLCVALLAVASSAFVVPGGKAALLNGALCKPCIDMITVSFRGTIQGDRRP